MPERNPMTAIGDTQTIDIKPNQPGAVAVQTAAGAAAGDTVVLEASVNGTDWVTPVTMVDPVGKVDVTSLVGANKSGYADLPGFQKARLRCTAVTTAVSVALRQVD